MTLYNKASNAFAVTGSNRFWLFLSIAMPMILLLAFLGIQFLDLDAIGWNHGFEHPLTGWDHLLTMLAVGIWAAQLRGQAIWMLPACFVGVMSLGGLAGAAGLSLPSVEGIILLSCAVFGVLITRRVRFSAKINVLIVAFFAFFHGFAHGQEISASASLISYTLGFMLATLLLHGAGILVAKLVVLSVTFMLTAVFSGAALAKVVAPSATDDSSAVIAHVFVDHVSTRFASDQSGGSGNYQLFDDDMGRLGSGLPDVVLESPKISISKLTIPANVGGMLAKTSLEQALVHWPGAIISSSQYGAANVLPFKQTFPDINHTPGKQLLSNGVGLTSPPVAVDTALTLHAIRHSHNSPVQLIEASALQSKSAKLQSGSIQSINQIFSCSSLAQRPLGHRPHCTQSADFRPIGLSLSITSAPASLAAGQDFLPPKFAIFRERLKLSRFESSA